MTGYVLRRLLASGVVVWGTVTILFIAIRLVPGDPAQMAMGFEASPELVERVRQEMGLDQPILVQYLDYLRSVAVLDLGDSLIYNLPAWSLVLERVPATLQLASVAMSIGIAISIPLGVMAALRVNSIADRIATTLSLMAQSLPQFWVGIMLILIMARMFGLFPSSGAATWRHYILPAVTLALPLIGILTRLVRSGLLEVLNKDYVQTARAKGLRERSVLYVHCMRNMLAPVVTVAALQFGDLLAGSIIVEVVFSWPGVGRLLINSIDNRDYALLQATILLISLTFVALNFVVDLLYGYLDPRIRLESE